MAQKLVTKADFARMCGVQRQSVNKAMKEGPLHEAVVSGRIDVEHPAAVKYLNKPRKKRPSRAKTEVRPKRDPTPEKVATVATLADGAPTNGSGGDAEPLFTDSGVDISQYADYTLRQIADTFGAMRVFKDFLEALKKLEDIREKRLNNEEVQRNLISRELVKTHVFGFLDAGNRRLLGDTPKTIARRLYALARADEPIETAEKLVRDIIGSQLTPQKGRVAKMLREAG